MEKYRNPVPTVDIIIEIENKIVLVERKNPPFGWALPGGFVDYGETVEHAAEREAFEETSLRVKNLKQFHVYSDPHRDERMHTLTVVFFVKAEGIPIASDDAKNAQLFKKDDLPVDLAFDHSTILDDFITGKYR